MASCSGESREAVKRRKGFWWSREDTLQLISQYREHERKSRFSVEEKALKKEKGFKSRNEYLQWLQECKGEKKRKRKWILSPFSEPAVFVTKLLKRKSADFLV